MEPEVNPSENTKINSDTDKTSPQLNQSSQKINEPAPAPNNQPTTQPIKKKSKTLIILLAVFIPLVIIIITAVVITLFIFSSGKKIDTPCYKTEVPKKLFNATNSYENECYYVGQLWGYEDNGKIVIPSIPRGKILGRVGIYTMNKQNLDKIKVTNVDELEKYIREAYVPSFGKVINGPTKINVDGLVGYQYELVDTKRSNDRPFYYAIFMSPQNYNVKDNINWSCQGDNCAGLPAGQTQTYTTIGAYNVEVDTPQNDGKQILDQIIKNWRWKK